MKIGRTNSTTKCREAAPEKLGREEMQKEAASKKEGTVCTERQRNRPWHQGAHMGKANPHNIWL